MREYLESADALPLRDYVPVVEGPMMRGVFRGSCRGQMVRSEPDDDINYTVLALQLMEDHGLKLETADVARAWLRFLPVVGAFLPHLH